jgi:hypothetical protein
MQVIFNRAFKIITALTNDPPTSTYDSASGTISTASTSASEDGALFLVGELLERNRAWVRIGVHALSHAAGLAIAFLMKKSALTYRYTVVHGCQLLCSMHNILHHACTTSVSFFDVVSRFAVFLCAAMESLKQSLFNSPIVHRSQFIDLSMRASVPVLWARKWC